MTMDTSSSIDKHYLILKPIVLPWYSAAINILFLLCLYGLRTFLCFEIKSIALFKKNPTIRVRKTF